MKVTLLDGGRRVKAKFNPEDIKWKSKNYGRFTPDGVYFPEIGKTLFVKRLPGRPLSMQFLKAHMVKPVSERLPTVYGVVEEDKTSYVFMEHINGVSLDALRGRIGIEHCHEILSGVFKALRRIANKGYWHTDLDFGNIFLGQGESDVLVRMIDIDSCVPASLSIDSYMENPARRLNVNEKYWSYIISSMKGKGMDRLTGKTIAQSAFMYFAVDLFFYIKYPDRYFSLKPADLNRLMKPANKKYFPKNAKKLWRRIHRRMRNNPEKGVAWREVDGFVSAAYRFTQGLEYTQRPPVGEPFVDIFINAFERFFSLWQ